MNDVRDLAEKIDEAKGRLPLPELMTKVGLGDRIKKSARCPFHNDQHPSFSVFQDWDDSWYWKCHAGCGDGDEIDFLVKYKDISRRNAIRLYLEMAGFPPSRPPKSHQYPKSPKSPESRKSPKYHESLVYPMSNGQGLEEELEGLAARKRLHRAQHR